MLDIAHKRECLEDRKREICVFILSLVVFVTFFLGLGSAILLWKLIKSLNGSYRLMEHRHFMFLGLFNSDEKSTSALKDIKMEKYI